MPRTPKSSTGAAAKISKVKHTVTAHDDRAGGVKAARKAAAAAAAWCLEHGKTAGVALATGNFKPATHMMVRSRLGKRVEQVRDHGLQVLTNDER
tara:strand:- start:418 stop:702 length:285 start_codon:yes stop_codon:yes gene_type:complete